MPSATPMDYVLLVASEGNDRVFRVRYGTGGLRVEHEIAVGTNPAHVNGPHGVSVAPDGRSFYVTTGHGTPFGSLWKYATQNDSLIGRVTLGLFPATVQVAPDGALAFVVNFNLHGAHEPSSVSVVSTDDLTEVARLKTCVMPHGSRLNAQGTKHYSVCMMDDRLVEIDAQRLAGVRMLSLVSAADTSHDAGHGSSSAHGACSPTWAQPSPDGEHVFVACNASSTVIDVDVRRWAVARVLQAGPGVYSLAITNDGRRLVATNKRDQSVSVFDLSSGRETARIRTSRPIASGVVVSPDMRYAFVTAEGIGSEPGSLNVVDLDKLALAASLDLGLMTGGIDLLRVEPRQP